MTASNPLNSPQFDTLDAIVREYVRVKLQSIDIRNYNGANLAYTHAADMANKLGLDERQKIGITPFPAPTTVSIQQAPPTPEPPPTPAPSPAPAETAGGGEAPSQKTAWPSWLPPLLGGAAGVAVTLLAGQLFFSSPKEPPKPEAKPPAQVAGRQGEGEVGLTVEGIGE